MGGSTVRSLKKTTPLGSEERKEKEYFAGEGASFAKQ